MPSHLHEVGGVLVDQIGRAAQYSVQLFHIRPSVVGETYVGDHLRVPGRQGFNRCEIAGQPEQTTTERTSQVNMPFSSDVKCTAPKVVSPPLLEHDAGTIDHRTDTFSIRSCRFTTCPLDRPLPSPVRETRFTREQFTELDRGAGARRDIRSRIRSARARELLACPETTMHMHRLPVRCRV